jgi:hypothetical protein
VDQGVPKIVIVITDGESDNNNATLTEAKKLKDRGFNIVSIGIGDLKEQELIDMASSPNDVFKVDDFDKVLLILSSISLSACQQPAIITEEKEIKSDVAQNSYKYFKYSLEDKPDNFTIEVTDLKGETEFYYSFEDENPKSPEDFIKQNTTQTDIDMNFIEKNLISKDVSSFKPKYVARVNEKKKTILITRPLDISTDFLFIGVKGIMQTNEFQFQISDKIISLPSTIDYELFIFIIVISILVMIFILFIFVLVLFIIMIHKYQKSEMFNVYWQKF